MLVLYHARLWKVVIILILSLTALDVQSQGKSSPFFDMLDGRFDMSDYLSENAYGFLPVPIIITDPAVDGGLGAIGLFFHESEEEKLKRLKAMKKTDKGAAKHLMPPSVSAVAAAVTGNDSFFYGGGHMGFFKQGRIRYKGGGGYGDVNLDYFGSGNVNFQSPIALNTKANGVFQSVQFKLAESVFFLGVSQRYISADISQNSLGDLNLILPPDYADELENLLSIDVTISALGLNLEFDTRDNVFSPQQGYRYTMEYLWFRDVIGSDIDYELVSFDALHYWSLAEQWRMGLRIDSEFARVDDLLPPFVTPFIDLRGIPAMRYQGNLIGIVEIELNWQLDSRWGLMGFSGVGRASNSTAEFSNAPSQVTKGFGFRYQVARRYGFDAGLDFAWGPEDFVWYITVGSAWGR
ncbi:MAG: hypothetical protein ACC707_19945 [Thiohalomonadales bacterium]